jgi:GGDEF domain-containing protein
VATPKGETVILDMSIGYALAPEEATTRQELLARADIAMYKVKRGR